MRLRLFLLLIGCLWVAQSAHARLFFPYDREAESFEISELPITLRSDFESWPVYVNMNLGYTIRYPRELRIYEPSSSEVHAVDFVSDETYSYPDIRVYFFRDENAESIAEWIAGQSKPRLTRGPFLDKHTIKVVEGNTDEVDATVVWEEFWRECIAGACEDRFLVRAVRQVGNSFFVASGLPAEDSRTVLKRIVASGEILFGDHPQEQIERWQTIELPLFSVSYPFGWFKTTIGEEVTVLSSFDIERTPPGEYLGGIVVYLGKEIGNPQLLSLDLAFDLFFKYTDVVKPLLMGGALISDCFKSQMHYCRDRHYYAGYDRQYEPLAQRRRKYYESTFGEIEARLVYKGKTFLERSREEMERLKSAPEKEALKARQRFEQMKKDWDAQNAE